MIYPPIYLASQSPRRRELLQQIGVEFEVISVDVDESVLVGESAEHYTLRVAKNKAQAGWQASPASQRPVLGADTAVVVDGKILGKPKDLAAATEMLEMLSGRRHQVYSAVALCTQQGMTSKLCISEVSFAALSSSQIADYIATGEGVDKAGSYAVQGLAAMFIERINGSYSGIMGLPLRETVLLLEQVGVNGE
jgi:septum formation protein